MIDPIEIRATLGGKQVTREEVRAWEVRRTGAVLKKFAAHLGRTGAAELMPDLANGKVLTAPLTEQRSALTAMKVELGPAGIYAMLKRELAVSERMARIGVATSRGRWKYAITRLEVPGYSAELFADWFGNLTATNAVTDMIEACPDHHLLRGLPDGRQEVVETTGGSPAATRFLVDYTSTDAIAVPIDPAYPVQIAGAALLPDGSIIGGVRHQFRDHDGTLAALLTVQFPASLPAWMISRHRWHLACEFSNWLIAAAPTAATGR